MVGTDFTEAGFDQVVFTDCNGKMANLAEGKLKHVSFEKSDFSGGGFQQCMFKAVSIQECSLIGSEFFNTQLSGVDFTSSEIGGIVLSGAELRGAVVTAAQACDLSRFLGLVIR